MFCAGIGLLQLGVLLVILVFQVLCCEDDGISHYFRPKKLDQKALKKIYILNVPEVKMSIWAWKKRHDEE